MTTLLETLPILEESVPALPGKVHQVAAQAEALRDAVQGALEEFTHRRQQVHELAAQVKDAMMTLRDRTGDEKDQLNSSMSALEAAVRSDLLDPLDQAADEVEAAADATTTAMSGLEGSLASGGSRVQAAHDQTETAFDALAAGVRTGKDELEGALQTLSADLDAVEQEVADGRAKVDEGVTTLSELMSSLVEQARARMQQAAAHLGQLASDHETALGAAIQDLATGREELVREWKDALTSDVEQPIQAGLGEVEGALQELGRRAAETQERSQGDREEAATETEAVGQRLPVLDGGVEGVKQAAGTVGLDWA